MKLVEYSDSGSDDDTARDEPGQTNYQRKKDRKRKRSNETDNEPSETQERRPKQPHASLLDTRFHKFYDMYTTEPRLSAHDDPSLHGGRKRITPHVVGNWPSHVYLEWIPTSQECESITSLLSHLEAAANLTSSSVHSTPSTESIRPLHVDKLDNSPTPQRLHISLSTTLNIRTEQRQEFLEQMARSIKEDPFLVRFTDVHWVSNHDGSRWFLVLKCENHTSMRRLLDSTNSVAASFSQNLLYKQSKTYEDEDTSAVLRESTSKGLEANNATERETTGVTQQSSLWVAMADRLKQKRRPQRQRREEMEEDDEKLSENPRVMSDCSPFHVSIAWSLGRPPPSIRSPRSVPAVKAIMEKEMMQCRLLFERVKVKVGDKVTPLPLGNIAGYRYVWDNGQRLGISRWEGY